MRSYKFKSLKNYSNDNCLCRAEEINNECPRHGLFSYRNGLK